MKELHVNDQKISHLMLMKTVELEVENKALQENNEEIRKNLEILKELLRQSQNKIECLKTTYKKLESDNNDLLADLQTKKQTQMNFRRFSENLSNKSEDNIYGVQNTNYYSIESILIKLFLLISILKCCNT